MSRLMGGAAGGGGVRGWRLDEATMPNPTLATCLNVRSEPLYLSTVRRLSIQREKAGCFL
jgi:hypothetical protein